MKPQRLVAGLVVASRPAGFAVHQAVGAQPNVKGGLAKAAILVTLAVRFGLLALGAAIFDRACSGTHDANLLSELGETKRDIGNSCQSNSCLAKGLL